MEPLIRQHAGSLVFIALGLVNITIQLLMPDLVPDILNAQIADAQQYPEQQGLVFTLNACLYIWYFGGLSSLAGGIIAIFIGHHRS